MYLLSFLVFMVLCVIFMACMSGGSLNVMIMFIDMPSIIFVILLLVPMLLHAGVFKDLNNAFRLGGKRRIQAGKPELIRAVEAVSYTIKALWTAGIFSAIVGFVCSTTRGGVGVDVMFLYAAVAFIPLIYTTFFVILLLPLRTRLKMHLKLLCEECVNAGATNVVVNNVGSNGSTVDMANVELVNIKANRIGVDNNKSQYTGQEYEESVTSATAANKRVD